MTKKPNKLNYILFINASKDKELDVFLILGAKIIDRIKQTGDYKVTEYLLKSIDQILKHNKIKTNGLAGIMAVTGPGAFTSLRITIALANTLAYSLNIPVVGIINKQGMMSNDKLVKSGLSKLSTVKIGSYLIPFYNKAANITIKK